LASTNPGIRNVAGLTLWLVLIPLQPVLIKAKASIATAKKMRLSNFTAGV
jgi:hypothetical protein